MRVFRFVPFLALTVLTFANCATNPATGARELMLVSEGQEVAMGRQADPEVVASFGLYPDSGLQRYVRDIGLELAATSERPQLPWSFRVVDDPVVNAFALPGGFIYITRGIMAHFDSEAQLAAVLGHEIGHVTARHSASQMSQQQLAQVGLVAGMILAPDLQDYLGVASVGLQLLFLKHSRDDEREADLLGFRYMQRDSYDTREMPPVFAMLGAVSAASGAERAPGWLSTHPEPEDREQRIQALIAQSGVDFSGTRVARDEYLQRLDGMVYGANPREGYFRGATFLHPDLEFQFDFPTGWQTVNQKQAVLGQSPQKDAMMELRLAAQATPEAAARAFLEQEGVTAGRTRSQQINGLPAVVSEFQVATQQGTLRGLVTFIAYNQLTYRLLGYSTNQRWGSYQSAIGQSMGSFERLTDRRVLTVEPMRLDVVRLDRSMTMRQLVEQRSTPESAERLALINQVDPDEPMERGRLVKLVVGTRAS